MRLDRQQPRSAQQPRPAKAAGSARTQLSRRRSLMQVMQVSPPTNRTGQPPEPAPPMDAGGRLLFRLHPPPGAPAADGCTSAGRHYANGAKWHPVMGPFGAVRCVVCKCAAAQIECYRAPTVERNGGLLFRNVTESEPAACILAI